VGGDAQCLWSSFLRGERNGAMRSDSTSCNTVTAVSKDVALQEMSVDDDIHEFALESKNSKMSKDVPQ